MGYLALELPLSESHTRTRPGSDDPESTTQVALLQGWECRPEGGGSCVFAALAIAPRGGRVRRTMARTRASSTVPAGNWHFLASLPTACSVSRQ